MVFHDGRKGDKGAALAALRGTFVTQALLLVLTSPASAQRSDTGDIVKRDFGNAWRDILHIWTSPARVHALDLPVLIGITQAVVITGTFDGEIQQWLRENPRSLPARVLSPFEEPAPLNLIGRSFVLQPLSAAMYVTGLIADSEDLRAAGIGCSTSVLANTIARYMIGRTTGRVRPRYTEDPYDMRFFTAAGWERRSFPNGHGANIMACVSYWNHHFDLGLARPLLYFVSVAVGSARTTAEAHWLSDTVFGLVFGYAVGKGVAARFNGRTTAELRELQAMWDGTRVHPGLTIGWRIPVR